MAGKTSKALQSEEGHFVVLVEKRWPSKSSRADFFGGQGFENEKEFDYEYDDELNEEGEDQRRYTSGRRPG